MEKKKKNYFFDEFLNLIKKIKNKMNYQVNFKNDFNKLNFKLLFFKGHKFHIKFIDE
jgi:hypothetical protein